MPQFIYTMKGLGKVHPPDTKVLEDIWLSFLPGAKIGVLGLNGAGKSSILKIMSGEDQQFLGEAFPAAGIFHNIVIISIEKRYPGQEKSGRQVTVSADLIYDVLRTHEPDHILLQATRADAAAGLLDVRRLAEMLSRIPGRIVHKNLDHISPLAVPIMLEIGKERVPGEANETLLEEASLVEEAMGSA